MIRIAVDTSALLALANPRDQHHRRAMEAMARAREEGVTWVSTMLVLSELHGHLIRYLTPGRAREIIRALSADKTFDWVAVDDQLVRGALDSWMARFSDQPFSLTDAVTFEVMRVKKLTVAFAFDRHFTIVGYRLFNAR